MRLYPNEGEGIVGQNLYVVSLLKEECVSNRVLGHFRTAAHAQKIYQFCMRSNSGTAAFESSLNPKEGHYIVRILLMYNFF